jgi:hypothetical protein
MRIEARHNASTRDFTVVVGDSVYEMNADAHLPNGCCIHLGDAKDLDLSGLCRAHEVPVGIMRKVVELVQQQYAEAEMAREEVRHPSVGW